MNACSSQKVNFFHAVELVAASTILKNGNGCLTRMQTSVTSLSAYEHPSLYSNRCRDRHVQLLEPCCKNSVKENAQHCQSSCSVSVEHKHPMVSPVKVSILGTWAANQPFVSLCNRDCKHESNAASVEMYPASWLHLDVCSELGLRLRAKCKAIQMSLKYRNKRKCSDSHSDAGWYGRYCGSDLNPSPDGKRIQTRGSLSDGYVVVFNHGRKASDSDYVHKYSFTFSRRHRREFCRRVETGLDARSRRLKKTMKQCTVTLQKLLFSKLQLQARPDKLNTRTGNEYAVTESCISCVSGACTNLTELGPRTFAAEALSDVNWSCIGISSDSMPAVVPLQSPSCSEKSFVELSSMPDLGSTVDLYLTCHSEPNVNDISIESVTNDDDSVQLLSPEIDCLCGNHSQYCEMNVPNGGWRNRLKPRVCNSRSKNREKQSSGCTCRSTELFSCRNACRCAKLSNKAVTSLVKQSVPSVSLILLRDFVPRRRVNKTSYSLPLTPQSCCDYHID